VVRLRCAPTEREVVLVRDHRDGDGLEPGNRNVEGAPDEAKAVVDGGMHRRCHRRCGRRGAVNPGAFGAPLRGCGD
jgi:hypothetical protein